MRATHPVCSSAAGIKKIFTEMIQGIDLILYVCDIFFIPHPVLYILLLWNDEMSGVKVAIQGWGSVDIYGTLLHPPRTPRFSGCPK